MVGEEVLASLSGARGAVLTASPLVIDAPTKPFQANDEVSGTVTGARVRLSTTPYSGAVDVTVENERGMRLSGARLVGGFVYV